MSYEYGAWSIADLKSELRRRNAKITGRKAALIQRLKDYDLIFGDVVNNPTTTYIIKTPSPQEFRDVNSDTLLPHINHEDLEIFSIVVERDDLDSAKNMYLENFLLSARFARGYLSGEYFVKGCCASEMRKHISYYVIIKYETHTIIETQCECAAGMGPYAQCKHVLTVLYGLIDFYQNKEMKIRKTCTEQLQAFHRPSKFYSGEPVETENLNLKLIDQQLKDITNFDPRPDTLKNIPDCKFMEQFKNNALNFSATEQLAMPILKIMSPGNPKALYSDHDYFKKTPEEMFLDSLILNAHNRKKLESETRINKKIWKQQRLLRLQSSQYGRICKCKEEGKSTLAKMLLKDNNIVTAATKYGLKYEEKAIKAFMDATGLQTTKCGIIVHEELQYLGCTPDGLIGPDAVLEVKCPYTATRQTISPETVPYLYLCDKTGNFRLQECHDYYYQVQGQLFCTQRQKAFFVIYTLIDICIIVVDRNDNFIQSMTQKLQDFYEKVYKGLFLKRHFYKLKI